MTAHGTHLTAGRRWFLASLLLTIALVATACRSGLAAQAAVPDSLRGVLEVASQGSLAARGVSVAVLTVQELTLDSVAEAGAVTYRVGQTATVGSLRVTLDKVAATAGEAGNWPQAGQRFLLVYVTVENTGQAAQALTSFSTSVTDMAGTHYFVEPNAGYLSAAQPLDASIPAGGRMSGIRAYMLPVNAGNLIWTGEDASHNRATFAVSTTDIVALR